MLSALKNLLVPFFILVLSACRSVGDAYVASAAEGEIAPAANMKTARSGHTATLLPTGNVLITGGMNGNENYSDTVEIYSPETGTFRPTQSLSTRRVGHTAT